jgi:hypothetical protein
MGKYRGRWYNDIEINVTKIRCGDVNYTELPR